MNYNEKKAINSSKYCNLKDDLEFLLSNKEQAFTETHNIFEIYFVEKED